MLNLNGLEITLSSGALQNAVCCRRFFILDILTLRVSNVRDRESNVEDRESNVGDRQSNVGNNRQSNVATICMHAKL